VPDRSALGGAASDTRTTTRSTRRAWGRLPRSRRGARGGTNGSAARRLWRWRRARETGLRGEQVVVGRVESAGPAEVGEPVSDREQLALAIVEKAKLIPSANAAARRARFERLGACAGSETARRRQPSASASRRTGEVAAVDRGDVARQKRRQVARVVPVQEVPFVALQALQRRERDVQACRSSLRAKAASGRAPRASREGPSRCSWARFGGRRPRSPPGSCREEARGPRAGQRLEVGPRLPCDLHEERAIPGRQVPFPRPNRLAEPVCEDRRNRPENAKRHRERKGAGARRCGERDQSQRHDGARAHLPEERADPSRRSPAVRAAWAAAVSQSRSRRRVMTRRTSVRPIA